MSNDAFARTSFPALGTVERVGDADARAAGFAAGYAAGMRQARTELAEAQARRDVEHEDARRHDAERTEQLIDVLNTALKSTLDTALPVVTDAEDSLRRAALALAAAVVGHELADDERAAASIVTRVLAHPQLDQALEIRLSRADLAVLDQAVLERIAAPVTADDALERGDGIVRFADGLLDARIGTALDRATRALGEVEP